MKLIHVFPGAVENCYEQVNEPSVPIKGGKVIYILAGFDLTNMEWNRYKESWWFESRCCTNLFSEWLTTFLLSYWLLFRWLGDVAAKICMSKQHTAKDLDLRQRLASLSFRVTVV